MTITISTRGQDDTGIVLSNEDVTVSIDDQAFHPATLFDAQRIRNHVAKPDRSGADVARELLETGQLTPIDAAL